MNKSESRVLPAKAKLFLGAILALSTITMAQANGVNTAGTVLVNNTVQLEALLNITAFVILILGTAGGSAIIIACLRNTKLSHGKRCFRVALGALLLLGSLNSPDIINYLLAVPTRCASLFN